MPSPEVHLEIGIWQVASEIGRQAYCVLKQQAHELMRDGAKAADLVPGYHQTAPAVEVKLKEPKSNITIASSLPRLGDMKRGD